MSFTHSRPVWDPRWTTRVATVENHRSLVWQSSWITEFVTRLKTQMKKDPEDLPLSPGNSTQISCVTEPPGSLRKQQKVVLRDHPNRGLIRLGLLSDSRFWCRNRKDREEKDVYPPRVLRWKWPERWSTFDGWCPRVENGDLYLSTGWDSVSLEKRPQKMYVWLLSCVRGETRTSTLHSDPYDGINFRTLPPSTLSYSRYPSLFLLFLPFPSRLV